MYFHFPSPVQCLPHLSIHHKVWVKREDAIHTCVSGNKIRKLEGYIDEIKGRPIVTLGGPFSNHIHAIAAWANAHKISSLGLIRGLEMDPTNPTLQDAINWGMKLVALKRSTFAEARQGKGDLVHKYVSEGYYFIPEGGKGELGQKGFTRFANEVATQQENIRHVVVAAGTGTTAIGIANSMPHVKVWAILCVRDPSIPEKAVRYLHQRAAPIQWVSEYTYGGFGRIPIEVRELVAEVYKKYDLPLDYVYTAKAYLALTELLRQEHIPKGEHVLFVHTGGLQGNRAYEYLRQKKYTKS